MSINASSTLQILAVSVQRLKTGIHHRNFSQCM